MGWNEYTGKYSSASIREGVMHLESSKEGRAITYAYCPIDMTSNFEIKCDVLVKKINDESCFGLVFDYYDNDNYKVFLVEEGYAWLNIWKDGRKVGHIQANIKLKEQRKANVRLSIKNTFQRLEFFVNGMKAFERRYLPLESCALGFLTEGSQKADFDNLEIIQ